MENLRLLLSSVVLLAVISGQLSRQFEANWRFGKAKQYCGQYLNKELAIVCNGTYNSFYLTKRSIDERRETSGEGGSNNNLRFLRPQVAKSFKNLFRRRVRRGIVEECCEKPCRMEELKSYCAPEDELVGKDGKYRR